MSLASNNRRDDPWFDTSTPKGPSLAPDQTFATPHPLLTPGKLRTQAKADTLLSTPWFGETATDAEEWRAAIAARRARASAVPTLILAQAPAAPVVPAPLPVTAPAPVVAEKPVPSSVPTVEQAQRPALAPLPSSRVPMWALAMLSSGLLLTGALVMGALTVLASLLVFWLG